MCSKILQHYYGEKPTDLVHNDAEDVGVVQTLEQPDTVASFHFEPTTQVTYNRDKPLLCTTDNSLLNLHHLRLRFSEFDGSSLEFSREIFGGRSTGHFTGLMPVQHLKALSFVIQKLSSPSVAAS